MVQLSRRAFLAASGSAALVAACGGGSGSSNKKPSNILVSFSDSSALLAGLPQRLTFGIADEQGTVSIDPPSPSLDFTITPDGGTAGPPITSTAHNDGIPRVYYPVEFTVPTAGVYRFSTTLNGAPLDADIQFPGAVSAVGPGRPMPPLDTPTAANLNGVQLLCTRSPQCPLHDVSLRAALAAQTPIAFLVSTPLYCQVAICGPVLELLLQQKDRFPQIKMLHAEVYATEADAQPDKRIVTQFVEQLGLSFEPALYLIRPDGSIMKRLDTIFDGVELRDALSKLAG